MEWISEPERKTPVVAEVDVLVCGGGIAGVAAAVCAARQGVDVMLLEKYGFLGGLVTTSLVITTPPLNNGINLEFERRLKEKSVYAPCRHSDEITKPLHLHAIDPEILKYELVNMLRESGVDILLHTYIVSTIKEDNRLNGIIMENKAGRQAVWARMVVDATGDADVAALAGAPFRLVKKPMTMMFNMVGVDVARAMNAMGNWGGIRKLVKEGIERKELEFDLGIYPEFGAPGVYAEQLVYKDEVNVWSGNLMGMNGVDPRDLTQAEITTREHAMRMAIFLKNKVPGFENARIEYTSTQVGVRATRQIIGEASPTMDEVKNIRFEDTVAKPYARNEMRLPYGSILPQNVENLLAAGRCISADEEAMGQLRLIPVCSATGQAAGTAAALSLKKGVAPRELDVLSLQEVLMEQGMELGLGVKM
ncbi:MAG: FAD-dependent oxidoreductase [Deltaproteobacteria bacterium]|nr:FAD-dependent oxidoreductase [Deltaproteobacteria bacterium]